MEAIFNTKTSVLNRGSENKGIKYRVLRLAGQRRGDAAVVQRPTPWAERAPSLPLAEVVPAWSRRARPGLGDWSRTATSARA